MKFGRRVVMGTAMAEIEGERGLAIGPAACIDAGSGAAQRTAPLSANREAGRYRAPIAPDDHFLIFDLDRGCFVFDARQCCKRVGARRQSGSEKPVLDVAAKGVEPDLACCKSNLGRPQEPPSVIDDPQDSQRRGMFAAIVPDAERVERAYRACEKRGGAVIWRRGGLGDQRGFDTGRRECDRGSQARRAPADDRHLGGQMSHLPPVPAWPWRLIIVIRE